MTTTEPIVPGPPVPPAPEPLLDTDCDGIPDRDDRCPREAEDRDGFEDTDGCPDPDNDRDGIPDACDACPDAPETFNGFRDEDGCPDVGRVRVQSDNIQIVPTVRFAARGHAPLPESKPVLDAIVDVLREHPEIERVAVVGHASLEEPDAARLSQRRADAVVTALVKAGVEAPRLEAHGAGNQTPRAPNDPKSREINRRVEFGVLQVRGEIVQRWDGTRLVTEVQPLPPEPAPPPMPVCVPGPPPRLPAEPCRVAPGANGPAPASSSRHTTP